MVLEIAEFSIQPGREDEFAAAYRAAIAQIEATDGFRSARMTQGIETPTRFVLLVEWDTLEAHTVGFRESDRYPKWRALISPFFAADPQVQHGTDV
ncbi:MAG TPA: antibiotic biosynthesis monooxygenase [Pseudonocardia sp.]|jgi:heme-degrading monooxygenase HmoA